MARFRMNTSAAELGVGFTGGAIGGLLGGGSGVFYVPALEKLTALDRHSLHGTAGAANIAVCGVGAATFALVGGSIDVRAGTGMVIGATIGGLFGAQLVLKIAQRPLRLLFIAILLFTGVKLILDAAGFGLAGGSALLPESLAVVVPVSLVLGIAIGAWSAGMGLGGGLLAVPVLMVLFGTDLPTAEGTSLLMFFPNAVVGTIGHVRQGTADTRLAAVLNIGALPGALIGVLVALALHADVLGVVFAAFSLIIAGREIWRMSRERTSREPTASTARLTCDEIAAEDG